MELNKYKDILHRCFRCGRCKISSVAADYNCPAYSRYRLETYSPGGLMWLIRGLLDGKIKYEKSLADILFSCAMCKSCSFSCPFEFGEILPDIITAARGHVLERPGLPPHVRDYLQNLYRYGNPWKEKKEKRGEFFIKKGIKQYVEGAEYLMYIGDVGSYDFRARECALSVCEILINAGVSFGILGSEEMTDGNEALRLGDDGLFQYIAEKNIKKFNKYGISKIITLSPHAYNVMKNDYPRLGGDFSVQHYTTFIMGLFKAGKLEVPVRQNMKVTFHDSCFLGRWNNEYEAPRFILKTIIGIEVLEMERSGKDAFCCGGGGGNFYSDMLGGGGKNNPAGIRVREAFDTGAEIIAVACPICLVMLEDALKTQMLHERMKIRDVSEILLEAIKSTELGEL